MRLSISQIRKIIRESILTEAQKVHVPDYCPTEEDFEASRDSEGFLYSAEDRNWEQKWTSGKYKLSEPKHWDQQMNYFQGDTLALRNAQQACELQKMRAMGGSMSQSARSLANGRWPRLSEVHPEITPEEENAIWKEHMDAYTNLVWGALTTTDTHEQFLAKLGFDANKENTSATTPVFVRLQRPILASRGIKMPEKLGYAYHPGVVKNPWQKYNSWADYWHTLSYAAHDISREFRVPVLEAEGWMTTELGDGTPQRLNDWQIKQMSRIWKLATKSPRGFILRVKNLNKVGGWY